MINKNVWSISNFTEKDINLKILSLPEIQHTEEDFVRLLADKESFEKDSLPKPEILLKTLNCKVKKLKDEETSNLCTSCYEQLNTQKYMCRICGNHTCKKCLIRERELRDESKTMFCQKCDQQYLQAMSSIIFYNKAEQLRKAFTRLVKEQQSIQQLVYLEKQKLIKHARSNSTSELISKADKSAKLTEQNKIMKIQCQQLIKKVQFGKNIHKELRKRLHLLRKKQKQSFGTMSNTDEYHTQIDPPRIDLDMSLQNIRDSVITLEQPRSDLSYTKKCKCIIY